MNCQKWSETLSFFSTFFVSTTWWFFGWHMKSSSRYSLVHILLTSSSKSGLRPWFFSDSLYLKWSSRYTVSRTFWDPQVFPIFVWNGALAIQSRDHSVDLIFQQWSETLSFSDFCVKWSSHYTVSCTFCRPLSPIEARTCGNRDPPATTTDGHFIRKKNAGFRARECFQLWTHAFPIAHISQLLDVNSWFGWHADVVDIMTEMMMWLTWWWDS